MKELDFYYVLLIFIANMYGLFLKKIKKELQLLKIFKKIADKSNHKPKKIWVNKGSEFYNRSMKSF